MKINSGQQQGKLVDLSEVYLNLQEQHRNVFMFQSGDQTFLYTTLGRKDYRELITNKELPTLDKEDVVCKICILWPENYDFDNCEAGIPSELCKVILKNSFLGDVSARNNVLNYYRGEMIDLDNQITCMINEAFSQFDIEEIETWDMDRTLKYLSRAEWKLQNLRGLPMTFDPFVQQKAEGEPEQETKPRTREIKEEPEKNVRGGAKVKMTSDKIAELAELKRKFPEIDWDADTILKHGKIIPDNIDPTPPALRAGW